MSDYNIGLPDMQTLQRRFSERSNVSDHWPYCSLIRIPLLSIYEFITNNDRSLRRLRLYIVNTMMQGFNKFIIFSKLKLKQRQPHLTDYM